MTLLEITIQKKKKWSKIAEENFPHRNQHAIKNRVIFLLVKLLQKDRKEVLNILKQDYLPFVENAIQMFKLKQNMKESEIKIQKSENISNFPEIPHKTNKTIELNVKQEYDCENRNPFCKASPGNISQDNHLDQNALALLFQNPFEICNNLILFNIQGFN